MPPTDTSSVKITIDVIDANSGETVSRVTKNLQGLGAAGKAAGQGVSDGAKKGAAALNELGAAGTAAGKKVHAGMDEAGAHTLTNLDKVRLLRDDLGIRIPRAMENVIARSKAASDAIGAIGSGLIALGAIEIFARMAMGAYNLYQRLADVNSEVIKYAENAAQAAQSKLFDTGSAETMRGLLQQTNAQIDALNTKRRNAGVSQDGTGSIAQYLGYGYLSGFQAYTKTDDKRAAAAREQRDAAQERLRTLDQQEEIEARTADGSARASAVVGAAARKAKRDSEEAIVSLKLQQTQLNERHLYQQSIDARSLAVRSGVSDDKLPQIYQPDVHAGEAEYNEQMRRISQQSGAENTADARKQGDETAHIRADAHSASLRGEQKYIAEYQEQQRQLRQSHDETLVSDGNFYRRRAALEEQYQAQRAARLRQEREETMRLEVQGSSTGFTGLGRADVEHAQRMQDITDKAPDFSDPNTKAQREAAETQRYQAEQQKEAEQFTERIQQLDDTRADHTMSANARIDAATLRSKAEIEKAWEDLYGNLDALDARRVTSYAALQAEMGQMDAQAAREKAEARQQLEDQTAKLEADGARRGMDKDDEQRQAVIDEYNERYKALEELRQKDADNADLYRRQEIAAEAVKNGKLIEQERAMRDKLAGEIRGLMNNPLEALKKMGEEAASKYAADLLMKATGRGTGTAGASGGRGGTLMSYMGIPGFGSHHPGAHGTGAPGDPAKAPPVVTASSNVSAASTTLRASSATIYVAQATFAGAGAGTGAGSSASGYSGTAGMGGMSLPGFDVGTAGSLGQLPGAGSGGIPGAAGGWNGGGGLAVAQGGLSMTQGVAGMFGGGGSGSGAGAGSGGAMSTAQGTINSVQGGLSAAQGISGLFKGGAATKTASALGKIGGVVGPAAGIFGAIESNGGAGGALQGAMSGMQLGGMIGGPLGAGIGAAAGAILGFIGIGGGQKAVAYYNQSVKPRIVNDITSFGMGSMPYQSAYDDLIALDKEARNQTKQWGMGGKREWDDKIHPDIMNAQQQLTREQKAGRSQYGMNAAEFHGGGVVNGFGDMATSPNEGWAHLQRGETVMHQSASSMHGDALSLMLAGASRGDMASYYGGGSTTPPGGDTHLHFHAPDASGVYNLFMQNKHHVRAALNASYAENSGGADGSN